MIATTIEETERCASPRCDVCGDRVRDEARFIAGRLLCPSCWRLIARARGKSPAGPQTPNRVQAALPLGVSRG
jgi:hypothetical protein